MGIVLIDHWHFCVMISHLLPSVLMVDLTLSLRPRYRWLNLLYAKMRILGFCFISLVFFLFSGDGLPKNVLFLVIDDLRPALGCYDYPKVLSPNINQLASLSVQFQNAHVQVICFSMQVSSS